MFTVHNILQAGHNKLQLTNLNRWYIIILYQRSKKNST